MIWEWLAGLSLPHLAGIGLVVLALFYLLLRKLFAWFRAVLLRLAFRQALLIGLGIAGISIEMFVPSGLMGVIEPIVSLVR